MQSNKDTQYLKSIDETLKLINKRQKKESRISLLVTIIIAVITVMVTFLVTAITLYVSVAVELIPMEVARLKLNGLFDWLFWWKNN